MPQFFLPAAARLGAHSGGLTLVPRCSELVASRPEGTDVRRSQPGRWVPLQFCGVASQKGPYHRSAIL